MMKSFQIVVPILDTGKYLNLFQIMKQKPSTRRMLKTGGYLLGRIVDLSLVSLIILRSNLQKAKPVLWAY